MLKIKYPTRCKILDVTGIEVFPGIKGSTPDISKPHIGKYGLAEIVVHPEQASEQVRITLDDGSVLWGFECWWQPLEEGDE